MSDQDVRGERRKLGLPDRRQHTYADLEERLDEHVISIEARLHRFFTKALAIFAIIGLTSAIALLGFSLTLSEIKETRRLFVVATCLSQNQRHDKAVDRFNDASARAIKRAPEFAKQIRESTDDNLAIIDALAPRQNCVQLGKVAVGEAKPPPPNPKPKLPKSDHPRGPHDSNQK